MIVREAGLACGSTRFEKNGHTRHGKQYRHCNAGGHLFGTTPVEGILIDLQ